MENPRQNTSVRPHRLWPFLFLAAAIILGATQLRRASQPAPLTPAAERKHLALAPVPLLAGGEWSLADHRGEVVLLNYWATWCEPCQAELPHLVQLSRDLSPKGLTVLGISLDTGPDRSARVRQFTARFQIPYTIAFPPDTSTLDSGPAVLPTTLLIDRHGRLAATVSGAFTKDVLAANLNTLLAEQ